LGAHGERLGASVRRTGAGAPTNSDTRIRKDFGLKAARIILGQRSPVITEIHAERDMIRAATVAAKIG